jgi:hypothetical protein
MVHGMLLVAVLIAGQPDREAKEATYKIVDNYNYWGADSVVAQKEKDRTVFVVTSESGIGGATIVLTGGEWPANVTLRFVYRKGRGFDMLEDIRMSTDRVVVAGTQKSSGKMPFCFAGPDSDKQDVIQPGGREAAGFLDVRVLHKNEAMDVTLPAHMLRGSTRLRVAWIDAFRR